MKVLIGILAAFAVLVRVTAKPHSGSCRSNKCFAVFEDPVDFSAAQRHCEGQSGHLMVQSSPYNDIMNLLLGSLKGDFWIGLRLPSGHCPDNSSSLRGYMWITGDYASDFQNWGQYNDHCSSKCVSVSQAQSFKWTDQSCDRKIAGFVCEYNFQLSCKHLEANDGGSVEYMTPLDFEGEDMASFPPGTTAVHNPLGTKFICFSEEWIQAPWTCEIAQGGCEYQCLPVNQKPVCICPPGQTLNVNNVTCEDAQNDPCLGFGCAHQCYQMGDSSASCICHHGFQLAEDGKGCRDVDNCVDGRQCPGDSDCVNTAGGFECRCHSGYRMENDICVDIDECRDFPCEQMCTNTKGAYNCSCYDGYIPIPYTPHMCKLHCPFEECPAECDPNYPTQCNCPEGYVSDEKDSGQIYCIDINECNMFFCDQGCTNTYGGYVCFCDEGYDLVDKYKCVELEVPAEGSGFTTPFEFPAPTVSYPTHRPSVVTAGGLLAIIVCIVIVVLVVVFLAHHVLNKHHEKLHTASGLRSESDDLHDLHQVTTDKHEKPPAERSLKLDT